jgi:hypothetical protein
MLFGWSIGEHSARTGGLIREMQALVQKGRSDLAFAAFLDFCGFLMASRMDLQMERAAHEEVYALARSWFTSALVDFHGIQSFSDLLRFVMQGPESSAQRALDLLRGIYRRDLLDDEERLRALAEGGLEESGESRKKVGTPVYPRPDGSLLHVLEEKGRIEVDGLTYQEGNGRSSVLPDAIAGRKRHDTEQDLFSPGERRVIRLLAADPAALPLEGVLFDRVGIPPEAIPPTVMVVHVPRDSTPAKEVLRSIRSQDALFVGTDLTPGQVRDLLPPDVHPLMVRIPEAVAGLLSGGGLEELIREAERSEGRFLDVQDILQYQHHDIAVLGEAA